MGGRPVTFRELTAIVSFVVASGGAIIAAWVIFGGTLPLQAKGYRVTIAFPSARTLVAGADVRISGVPVGRVVRVSPGAATTDAVIELRRRYAPLPVDARAIVRTKTPLGEAYVAITRGTPTAAPIREGGRLPTANVDAAQQIEDVLDIFDAPTRRALRDGMTDGARTLRGRTEDLNQALGASGPAAEDLGTLLTALDAQRRDVQVLVDRTGVALHALARRPDQLRRVVRAGDRVFGTTAGRAAGVTATVRALGGFVRELHATDAPLRRTLAAAAPTLRTLRPVTPLIAPALRAVDLLAPRGRALFVRLRPVLAVARRALGPATRLVGAVRPLGSALDAAGRQLVPIVQLVTAYAPDLAVGFPSFASSFEATQGTPNILRYARQAIIFTSEGDEGFAHREPTNRSNAYPAPGRALQPSAFSCANAANVATIPATGSQVPCVVAPPWEFAGRLRSFPSLVPYVPHRSR